MNQASKKNRLLYTLFFFLMFAVVIGDILSETFLLAHYPAEILSSMFIVNALALFAISLFTISGIDKFSRLKLFSILVSAQVGLLIGVRLGIHFDFQVVYLVLFTCAYTGKILLFLTYWTLANDLCDSREAKRVFPLIGASGIAGALVSNFSTAAITGLVGPDNTIFLWILLLGAGWLIMDRIYRSHPLELRMKPVSSSGRERWVSQIKTDLLAAYREPFIKTMGILYFFVFLLVISLDFHFFLQLKENFALVSPEKTALGKSISGFLGTFRGIGSAVTLIIQFFLAGFLLKKLGTARSMFVLPASLTLIFFLIFIQLLVPVFPEKSAYFEPPFHSTFFLLLLAGSFIKLSLFDSLFSPNFQIFFSSLPSAIRGRSKLILEGIVKPAAILTAGCSVLGVSFWIINRRPEFLWVHFLFLFLSGLLLCVAVFRLQKNYSSSISGFLGRYRAERLAKTLSLNPGQERGAVVHILAYHLFNPDENTRMICLETLGQLDPGRSALLLTRLSRLRGYPSRAAAVNSLVKDGGETVTPAQLEGWLDDTDRAVALAALRGLEHRPFGSVEDLARARLSHPSRSFRLGAVSVCWKKGSPALKNEARKSLGKIIRDGKPDVMAEVMETMGTLKDEALLPEMRAVYKKLRSVTGPDKAQRIYLYNLGKIPVAALLEHVFCHLEKLPEGERLKIYRSLADNLPIIQNMAAHWIARFNLNASHFLYEFLYVHKTALSHGQKKLLSEPLTTLLKKGKEMKAEVQLLVGLGDPAAQLLGQAIREGPLEKIRKTITYIISLSDPTGKLYYVAPKLLSPNKYEKSAAMEAVESSLQKNWIRAAFEVLSDPPAPYSEKSQPPSDAFLLKWADFGLNEWVAICANHYLHQRRAHLMTASRQKKFYNMMGRLCTPKKTH